MNLRVNQIVLGVILIGEISSAYSTESSLNKIAVTSQQSANWCYGEAINIAKWKNGNQELTLDSCRSIQPHPADISIGRTFLDIRLLDVKKMSFLWRYQTTGSTENAILAAEPKGFLLKNLDADQQLDFSIIITEAEDGDGPVRVSQVAFVGGNMSVRQGALPVYGGALDQYAREEFVENLSLKETEKLSKGAHQSLDNTWEKFRVFWYDKMGIKPPYKSNAGGSLGNSNHDNSEFNSINDLKLQDYSVEASDCTAVGLDEKFLITTYKNSINIMKEKLGQSANFAGHYYLIELPTPKGGVYTYTVVDCITGKEVANIDGYYTEYDPGNNDNGYEEIASATSRLLILKGILGDGEIAKPESYQSEYYEMINGELRLLRKTQPVIIRH